MPTKNIKINLLVLTIAKMATERLYFRAKMLFRPKKANTANVWRVPQHSEKIHIPVRMVFTSCSTIFVSMLPIIIDSSVPFYARYMHNVSIKSLAKSQIVKCVMIALADQAKERTKPEAGKRDTVRLKLLWQNRNKKTVFVYSKLFG